MLDFFENAINIEELQSRHGPDFRTEGGARGRAANRSSRRGRPFWLILVGLSICTPAGLRAQRSDFILKGPPEPQSVSPLMAMEVPRRLEEYEGATLSLSRISTQFQESYQKFILTVDRLRKDGKALKVRKTCLPPELGESYLAAHEAWIKYHQQARSVRGQQRQLEIFKKRGYAAGLTPDTQYELEKVLEDYEKIRQEHVSIQSLLRLQVEGEIVRIGCDPESIRSHWQALRREAGEESESTQPHDIQKKTEPAGGSESASIPRNSDESEAPSTRSRSADVPEDLGTRSRLNTDEPDARNSTGETPDGVDAKNSTGETPDGVDAKNSTGETPDRVDSKNPTGETLDGIDAEGNREMIFRALEPEDVSPGEVPQAPNSP